MKKLFCFLAVAGTALFTSCSSDDDNGGSNVTGITISSNASTVALGETFTFTVMNNLNQDVTSSSTIYVNNVEQDDNTFEATQTGTYTVKAMNGNLTSPEITVVVTENPATSITVVISAATVAIGEEVTFTAATNESVDVTPNAVFYVNDIEIEGTSFTPDVVGTYEVYAVYQDLTSAVVTFTATEEGTPGEPSNSFIVNGEEYSTPIGAFAYRGIYNAETEGEYVIIWDFNPYLEEGTGQNATYPNDLYITLEYPIEPTGTNPDTGAPTFTIEYPTTGNLTLQNNVIDAWVIANNNALLPQDANERAALIESITLNISSIMFAENDGDPSNLDAEYNITLTDGTVIEGQYSGDVFAYNGVPQGGGANGRLANANKLSKNNRNIKKSNITAK